MSVNRKVTVPDGGPTPTARTYRHHTMLESHTRPPVPASTPAEPGALTERSCPRYAAALVDALGDVAQHATNRSGRAFESPAWAAILRAVRATRYADGDGWPG
jgi:hypothetical protein